MVVWQRLSCLAQSYFELLPQPQPPSTWAGQLVWYGAGLETNQKTNTVITWEISNHSRIFREIWLHESLGDALLL